MKNDPFAGAAVLTVVCRLRPGLRPPYPAFSRTGPAAMPSSADEPAERLPVPLWGAPAKSRPDLRPFLTCGLFEDSTATASTAFVVRQRELSLRPLGADGRLALCPALVEYACRFVPAPQGHSAGKPLILMPSHDLPELVARTVGNLLKHGAHDLCDILLIDDRSTADYRPIVRDSGCLSYLRIDTDGGFNFSMLCNIGGFVARLMGHDTIILWNNDVWIERAEDLRTFLRKHRQNGATLSGVKLLYPDAAASPVDSEAEVCSRSGTVQFGGFAWIRDPERPDVFTPVHVHRFAERDDPRVNCDRVETCLTGALLTIDLAWFVRVGGLNPSLAASFQDLDLCLRACLERRRTLYYGADIFFWHAESTSLGPAKGRRDPRLRGDRALFSLIWRERLPQLIGGSPVA
jgi:GT2 family glycosyltransferase